jgi:hypothetical protein
VNARAGLLAALDVIELTSGSYEHDHNYETGCRDYEVVTEREIGSIADDLLAELGRRGWMLVRVDPFAAVGLPSGCCGGWIGPGGQRAMCCPVVTDMFDKTNAPAIGGADVEPAEELAARVERIERYLDGRTSTEPYSWRDA